MMEIKTTKTISNEYYEDDNTIGANPNPYKKWVAVDDLKKLEKQCDSKIQFYNELMDKLTLVNKESEK